MRITGLELGLNAGLTRLVIDASAPLEASLAAAEDGLGLVLTLPAASWAAPPPRRQAAGLIGRADQPVIAADHITLALQLIEPAVVERAFRLPPAGTAAAGPVGGRYRLVIDLRPADPAAFAAAFAAPVALPLQSSADILPPPPLHQQRRLVVLDPGHGGQDPGAISASGRYEKDVTLAVAQAVAARLKRTGQYRVLLTRESDRFIRLQQRVAFARQHEADLFLSVHADSLAGDHGLRGAGIYTLAKAATDMEAEALALRENKADMLAESAPEAELDDVVSILLDLASRDTARLSSRFAGLLGASLSAHIPLRPKALRAANFRVLTAPDIPSVLLELGYLSNPKDEALLFSDAGRAELADAVAAAIDRFFGVEVPQAVR
ncbi:MAG TPA: N-acetylmuramoyl-L-alanine amidase [Ferrovibrio sp.]|uniref:N-acetylmuramoyl-L-alanine amidase family protein n=1 Tax=Ferrovibrio sp. TaxID=1917215 RepID=UPI002ED49640